MVETEMEEQNAPARRLIIIVVENGKDPVIDYEPEGSFVTWEVVAALHRMIEIVEEEDLLESLQPDDGEETE